MTERNSKKCRIILTFALSYFNYMACANCNEIITNISKTEDVVANDDIKSQKTNNTKCFSKPSKFF